MLDAGGLALQLDLGATSLTEGDSLPVTVTLSQPPATAVAISFTQSPDNQFALPELVIPAGATSATISVPTIQDTLIEKNKHVLITASSPGYADAAQNVDLYDDDVPGITLAIDHAALTEADGPQAAIGTVTRDKVSDQPLKVYLSASFAERVSVPATVIIPAGQASVTFVIGTQDDHVVNSAMPVTVSAHGAYPECGCPIQPGAAAAIAVSDAEVVRTSLDRADYFTLETN